MQDEITKHGRKAYKAAKHQGHSIGRKIGEIFIEILIIVFAVSLSIWFHNWATHNHEKKEAKEFLRGLKIDLTEDIKLLEGSKDVADGLISSYSFLMSQDSTQSVSDSLIYRNLYFDLRVSRPNIGRYEGFKSSGKIGTLENENLKQDILVFYEQTIQDLVYGENFVNSIQSKILDLQVENEEKMPIKKLVATAKMKSLFNLGLQNFKSNASAYEKAIRQAKEIIHQIDSRID